MKRDSNGEIKQMRNRKSQIWILAAIAASAGLLACNSPNKNGGRVVDPDPLVRTNPHPHGPHGGIHPHPSNPGTAKPDAVPPTGMQPVAGIEVDPGRYQAIKASWVGATTVRELKATPPKGILRKPLLSSELPGKRELGGDTF